MAKFEVSVTRDAVLIRRYHVYAASTEDAENVVQAAVDRDCVGTLGEPVSVEYVDDEEDLFFVIDAEPVP